MELYCEREFLADVYNYSQDIVRISEETDPSDDTGLGVEPGESSFIDLSEGGSSSLSSVGELTRALVDVLFTFDRHVWREEMGGRDG